MESERQPAASYTSFHHSDNKPEMQFIEETGANKYVVNVRFKLFDQESRPRLAESHVKFKLTFCSMWSVATAAGHQFLHTGSIISHLFLTSLPSEYINFY